MLPVRPIMSPRSTTRSGNGPKSYSGPNEPDETRLRTVYENSDSIREVADHYPEWSYNAIRRRLIDYGIHEPGEVRLPLTRLLDEELEADDVTGVGGRV